jgi:hypothetical protein
MPDGIVQVPPDSTGKQIDTAEVSITAGQPVQRQRIVLGDPIDPAEFATVTQGRLNVSVTGGMFGAPLSMSGGGGASITPHAANDGFVQLPPDSTGKRLDTSIVTIGTMSFHRQRIVLGDGNNPTGFVSVVNGALNVNIAAWGGLPFNISSPADGQAIVFNGTTQQWEARTVQIEAPALPISFADAEIAGGVTGSVFTLQHAPNPVTSLLLVHRVPEFGGIVMTHPTDYDIIGATITLTGGTVMDAGTLIAWYRYEAT